MLRPIPVCTCDPLLACTCEINKNIKENVNAEFAKGMNDSFENQ